LKIDVLLLPIINGRPIYLSITKHYNPKILDKAILKLRGTFLLKDISDFCILIIYPEALSYASKIFFKAFVSVSFVLKKRKLS
jgi:hypothetical protein